MVNMNEPNWNIIDLFGKGKNIHKIKKTFNNCDKKENNKKINKYETYKNTNEDGYILHMKSNKVNQSLMNDLCFAYKKDKKYSSNENKKLNNKINKEMNNELSIKSSNGLDKKYYKKNYSYTNSYENSNKFNNNIKEKKEDGLIWKCVKNVYSSFASAVKKNILIYDKNIEESNDNPKQKTISSNSRLIDKKLKNRKCKDLAMSSYSIFSKNKNKLSDKHMNKSISCTVRNIEDKSFKNRTFFGMNKNNKSEEIQNKNRKTKSDYYDFFENDLKYLFEYDNYENMQYSHDNDNNNKNNNKENQKKYENFQNLNNNDINIYFNKRNYSNNKCIVNSNFYRYDSDKSNSFNKLSYDHLEYNLEEKKKNHNLISNNNQQSLNNLYNTDLNSNRSFFFQSSEDENINKNDNYFITNKKKKIINTNSIISMKNEKKEDKNIKYKDNILINSYFRDNDKKFDKDIMKKSNKHIMNENNLYFMSEHYKNRMRKNYKNFDKDSEEEVFIDNSDEFFIKKSSKLFVNDNNKYSIINKKVEMDEMINTVDNYKKKNRNFENSDYENNFDENKKEKSFCDKNHSWNKKNFKSIYSNKKEKKDKQLINISDYENEEWENDKSIRCDDTSESIHEKENFKYKNEDDEGYRNMENYNSFIKNNEEIKNMRSEYKVLIQLIDTFIDESLNSSNMNNLLVDKEKCDKNEFEKKKNILNIDSYKDEDSIKIIDDVIGDSKNKYVILKYNEDSLIEALEKLRIDKKKEKLEEEEEEIDKEEEEKKKKKKIDKNIFYKCNKKDQYETALYILNQKNNNKILIEKFNVPLLDSQVKCLIDKRWLNDEVINFYLSMLQEYNEQNIQKNSSHFPKIFTFSTFFFQSLSSNGSYNYSKVSRWTKRKKIDIFSFDLILIPLHVGGNHWTLGVINVKDKKIKLYDSLNMPNKKFFEYIKRYIVDEARDKKQIEINISTWEYDQDGNSEEGIPYQENGYDCGVFTCMFAKCLSFNREFDFSQKDIRDIRIKMVYEISQGCLMF